MKKSFIAMGLAVASTLFFSNCKKVEIASNETSLSKGTPFEIVANAEDTKTTNDGLNTKWAANDALTVFHAVAGTTSYGKNDEFTVSGAAATSFSGTLQDGELDNTKSYDWYAFYPYSSYIGTPKNTSSGYLNIGSSSSTATQKQTGNSSKSHLAGQYFPLYGKVANVAAGTTPSITMKQALAVIKVSVTNNTGENLTVTNIDFTAPESIIGQYYIDFAGDSPIFTEKGYLSNTAKLEVTGGAAIANAASADFYIAVKPFTATAGSTLKIAVNGYEKSVTVPAGGVAFTAGTIKKVEFNFNQAPPQVETGKYMAFVKNGEKYYALSSTPNGTRLSAVEITYNNETTLTTTNASIIWDITNTSGSYTMKNNNKYIAWTSGNTATTQEGEYGLSIVANGNNWNIKSVADASRKLQYNADYKYFAFYTSAQVGDFYLVPATQDTTTPTLTLKKTSISDVAAAGVTDETEENVYTLENVEDTDVTVTYDGTIVTAASVSGGALTYTVAANTGEAREGWVKLALSGQDAKTITVSQKAPSSSITYQHIFSAKPTAVTGTLENGTTTLSGYTWNIASTKLGNYNSQYYAGVQFGTSSATGAITLTSPTSWSFTKDSKTVTKIKEIRLWLNTGGSDGNVTASVSIGGQDATSNDYTVTKNSSAKTDYTQATKITFTPKLGYNTGVIVINATTGENKCAGYICALEIEAEEQSTL